MHTKVLHAHQGERSLALVLESGEEVLSALRELADRERLSAASLTGIGAFSRATLGFFDLDAKDYRRIPVGGQVEVVSFVGNIALDNGQPKLHVHAVLADSDGRAMGGHLLEGHVRPTLELVIVESPRHLRRRFDRATGLALLDLS